MNIDTMGKSPQMLELRGIWIIEPDIAVGTRAMKGDYKAKEKVWWGKYTHGSYKALLGALCSAVGH